MPDNTFAEDEPSSTGPLATDTRPSRSRRLPVGPLGMLLITAVALLVALGAASLVARLADDGVMNVQDVLDSTAAAPLVPNTATRAEVGRPAPNVRLEFLDGEEQQLAELAGLGTPVVLNFWSSTCIPCLNEMPAFEQVHARHSGEITMIGVNVADTVDAGNEMVERTGVRYRNARDPRGEIFAVFGGIALPRTVLLAADGTVADTHSGELDADQLTALLAEHDMIAP
jgi:cytochrome c biogenesis protein CcmG, thiol:disulfide interchange protein DsbE